MLKKFQVVELNDGMFAVAFVEHQLSISSAFKCILVSHSDARYEYPAEAQEKADELNGVSDE